MAGRARPGPGSGGASPLSRGRRGRERGTSRRRRGHPGRQCRRSAVHDPAGPRRVARHCQGRKTPERGQRADRHRPRHGAKAVVIEDLDFTEARAEGRERAGNRPSRGKRGKAFRRAVSGIPTGKFRDRVAQMTYNAGLQVIAVDPAYTSRWGAQHWLAPLQQHDPELTGHHAAALVTGRRALGHRARRRAGVTRPRPDDRDVRAAPRAPGARRAKRDDGPRQAPRQPTGRKTVQASRNRPPPQAAQDRAGPPDTPGDSSRYLLLSH
jgi:hypothetical protein